MFPTPQHHEESQAWHNLLQCNQSGNCQPFPLWFLEDMIESASGWPSTMQDLQQSTQFSWGPEIVWKAWVWCWWNNVMIYEREREAKNPNWKLTNCDMHLSLIQLIGMWLWCGCYFLPGHYSHNLIKIILKMLCQQIRINPNWKLVNFQYMLGIHLPN